MNQTDYDDMNNMLKVLEKLGIPSASKLRLDLWLGWYK